MNEEAGAERPGISVVIPAYRAHLTIRRAVDSVLAQEAIAAKAIVVIDGHFDSTEEAIIQYPPDRVTVVAREENRGASFSRNEGLAHVDTKYVMFLDSDDFLEGPLLSSLVAEMGAKKASLGFGPVQILSEASGMRLPRYVPDYASPQDAFRKWHLEGIFVGTCGVVWETAFIRNIGGWDEELTRNDDGELVMRAILKGASFAISDRGCGIYVKHSGESLSNRLDQIRSILRANEKLLAIDSAAIPKQLQREACAGHYFNLAWLSYLHGQDELGDLALQRSRAMGFKRRGPRIHRAMFALLGLKRSCRLMALLNRLLPRNQRAA